MLSAGLGLCVEFTLNLHYTTPMAANILHKAGLIEGVRTGMKNLILISILIMTGCANYQYAGSTSLWDRNDGYSSRRDGNAGSKGFFKQEKNWPRGEYIPDRWEAELKFNAGMLSREEFDHYERVRSVYPHKDIKYIDENGNLRTPDVKISPDGRSIRIREALGDGY